MPNPNEPHTDLRIRPATIDDAPLLLEFIRSLATFEKMLDQVKATEASVRESLFGDNRSANVEALIAETNGEPVAFAVYFHN